MTKPKVKLTGEDGNAFNIIGKVRRALKEAKYSEEDINKFTEEATSGDYNSLLVTCGRWVDIE